MNLVDEIASYALDVDKIIKQLAHERDHLKETVTRLEQEKQSLQVELDKERAVRKPDKTEVDNGDSI